MPVAGQDTSFLEGLEPGQVVRGVVSRITHSGAFVDLGPAEGLITVSHLSWVGFDQVSDVVSVGEEVTVTVVDVDSRRGLLWLSLRRLLHDPFKDFART